MDMRKKILNVIIKKLIKSYIGLEQENYLYFIAYCVMQLNYMRNFEDSF